MNLSPFRGLMASLLLALAASQPTTGQEMSSGPAHRRVGEGRWSVRVTAFRTLAGAAVDAMAQRWAEGLRRRGIEVTNTLELEALLPGLSPVAAEALLADAAEPVRGVSDAWQGRLQRLECAERLLRGSLPALSGMPARDLDSGESLPTVLKGYAALCDTLATACRADVELLSTVAGSLEAPACQALALACRTEATAVEKIGARIAAAGALFAGLDRDLSCPAGSR
jgi:hypothetical protein